MGRLGSGGHLRAHGQRQAVAKPIHVSRPIKFRRHVVCNVLTDQKPQEKAPPSSSSSPTPASLWSVVSDTARQALASPVVNSFRLWPSSNHDDEESARVEQVRHGFFEHAFVTSLLPAFCFRSHLSARKMCCCLFEHASYLLSTPAHFARPSWTAGSVSAGFAALLLAFAAPVFFKTCFASIRCRDKAFRATASIVILNRTGAVNENFPRHSCCSCCTFFKHPPSCMFGTDCTGRQQTLGPPSSQFQPKNVVLLCRRCLRRLPKQSRSSRQPSLSTSAGTLIPQATWS